MAPGRTSLSGGWLAVQGRLPLAFMGLALVWIVVGTLMLLAVPSLLALPHSHPHVVALTHAWVLGFFVTVACGAVYQLAPVALGTTLANERYGWWHFWLHATGVPGMVVSFWLWDLELLGHFGFLVAIGIVLFTVNTCQTVKRSGRRHLVAWSVGASALWLLTTVLMGLLLAANRHWLFIPVDPIFLLRAHAHLGLIGFFVALLQGVSFQLIPMFTLGEMREWRWAGAGFWTSQGGLVVLAPALVFHHGVLSMLGAAAVAVGVTFSSLAMVRALDTRKKRALDPGVRLFLFGGVGVWIAAVAGAVLVAPWSAGGSASGGFNAMVYAVIAIVGGLLPCIAGMMCKIVPFLTWMRAYGPHVGRGRTPSAGALTLPRIERLGLALLAVAVVPLLVGAWTLSDVWIKAGIGTLAAGVALFTADMLGVMRHLWRPQIGAPVAVRAAKS